MIIIAYGQQMALGVVFQMFDVQFIITGFEKWLVTLMRMNIGIKTSIRPTVMKNQLLKAFSKSCKLLQQTHSFKYILFTFIQNVCVLG